MAVYEKRADLNSNHLTQTEVHLYGSSRLGILTTNRDVETAGSPRNGIFERGNKSFELGNHLENVLATVSDRRVQVSAGGTNVDYYQADMVSANDFYPGGMEMPGRKLSTEKYRYSINGQEKSPEIAPNTTTALFWQYDSRIMRRWSEDPVPKSTVSPYVCLGGNPIFYVDPLGNDWYKNKSTRNIEWFDGGESRKGYKKIRGDQNFRRRVRDQFGEKHWVDFSSDGTKSIWMEEVVLGSKSKKKGNSRMDRGYSHLNRSKEEINDYQTKQTSYFRGRENGMPADPSLTVQGVNFERWYQGYLQGRQLTYGATLIVISPVVIFGAAEAGAAGLAEMGPLSNWFRVGYSYSSALRAETFGIRWGASWARNFKYVKEIPNLTLRTWNMALRLSRAPGTRWLGGFSEPGHLHLWRVGSLADRVVKGVASFF